MGFKELFRKSNDGAACSLYSQSAAGGMARVEPYAGRGESLPNAIRIVNETPAGAPRCADTAPVKTVDIKTQAKPEAPQRAVAAERIAARAWEIWQREGCPAGRALDHWLQAEQELRG